MVKRFLLNNVCDECGMVPTDEQRGFVSGQDYDAIAARLAEAERVIRSVDKMGAEAIANGGGIVLSQSSALFSSAANYLSRHTASASGVQE
jgi:hypothetical protein